MTRFQVSVCKTVQETKCITVEVDAGCGWCFSERECKDKCSNSYAGHCKETDKEEACQVYSNDNLHRSWHNHCNFQDATALNKPENGASTLSCKKFPRKICFLMPSQNCSVVDETVCSLLFTCTKIRYQIVQPCSNVSQSQNRSALKYRLKFAHKFHIRFPGHDIFMHYFFSFDMIWNPAF